MAIPLSGIVLLLILWILVASRVSDVILPPVREVVVQLRRILTEPDSLQAIAVTVYRFFFGWGLSAVIGISLGLAMGLLPTVRLLLRPYLVLIQSVPRVSWILLAMFWFGIDGSVVVFLIVMTVVPFFVINVSDAVREVREERGELMSVFRLSPYTRIIDVYVPAISVALRSAASISLSVGWKAVVMAELMAAPDGIGARLSWAQGSFDTATVLAWTMIVASVALASHVVLTRFVKR